VRVSELFGALSERQFRLLWLGQAASVIGNGLVPVALAFAVLELTDSASDLGIVLAAQSLPLVVFLLAGGVWADRLPRQRVMVATDVVRGATQATIAVLLLSGRAELWHLVVLVAVYGTAEAFFRPAYTGLIPATISAARLQQANALMGMSASAGIVLGPALAGALVALVGTGVAFVVDAATFAVSAFFLLQLRVAQPARGAARSFLAELAGGWREVRSRTWLWAIILHATLYLFIVLAPYNVLGPLVAKESLGGASAWALIATAFGLGMLTGGSLALRYRPARPMFVGIALILLTAPSVALLALAAPPLAIAAAQLVTGAVFGFFLAVWETTLQQHVPEDKLSRVSAYDWMGSVAFLPLGYALAGPVSEAIGVSATLWVAAAWTLGSTLVLLAVRDVRELRRLEGRPAEPAATVAVVA
jgi:MFS family permease